MHIPKKQKLFRVERMNIKSTHTASDIDMGNDKDKQKWFQNFVKYSQCNQPLAQLTMNHLIVCIYFTVENCCVPSTSISKQIFLHLQLLTLFAFCIFLKLIEFIDSYQFVCFSLYTHCVLWEPLNFCFCFLFKKMNDDFHYV